VAFPEHQWLFLHPLDSVATIRRLVAFYVHEHNHVLPHSAFQGQTPDEMYFSRGNAVPADLRARAAAAHRARVAANRSVVRRDAWLRLLVLDDAWLSLVFGRCCSEVAPKVLQSRKVFLLQFQNGRLVLFVEATDLLAT
jgi:hypothetical protein